MYIINGIAYGGGNFNVDEVEVVEVRALDDMMLLLTFNSGEKRLYDATKLLKSPAFMVLEDEKIFKAVKIEYGVVTWCDGKIDIASETLYKNSFAYQESVQY